MTTKSIRTSSWFKTKAFSAFNLITRVFRWNWISIIALGISSNFMINAIFDYKYQRPLVSFSAEEYINAIFAAFVLLKGTRWITKKLDVRRPWAEGVTKRLLTQLSLHLVFIIVALNVLLISITYLFYGGFYSFGDLLVINVSVVSLTFFFSVIDVGIYFFKNWKTVSQHKTREAVAKVLKPIRLSLGKSQYLVKQEDILCAFSQAGVVLVMTKDHRKMPFAHSLEVLSNKLDPSNFFRANRQTVLCRESVSAVRSLDYGKLEVTLSLNGDSDSIIISRTRAAEFRKWLRAQEA